jgi:glutathione S-transferase
VNANAAPHMLLVEIGVNYDLVLVDRAKNAHKSRSFPKPQPSCSISSISMPMQDSRLSSEHLTAQSSTSG